MKVLIFKHTEILIVLIMFLIYSIITINSEKIDIWVFTCFKGKTGTSYLAWNVNIKVLIRYKDAKLQRGGTNNHT